MSKGSFYWWLNKFSNGNEQVKDESKRGTPKSAQKEDNFSKSRSCSCKTANVCEGAI